MASCVGHIAGGRIAAVAKGLARGRDEIDARGRLVTPGFVDVHTHYDGQVTWSHDLSPSSQNGVTTAVMGNCGVGFAQIAARAIGDRAAADDEIEVGHGCPPAFARCFVAYIKA